jgi:hypothetical protein
MATLSSKSFTVDTPQTRAKRGPLVRVEISPGRFVKMHEQDAVAAGHIKPKGRPPQEEDKQRPAGGDKSGAGQPAGKPAGEPVTMDDLTTVAGVGRATARALQARGITTFEQLRQAGPLDYLSPQTMQAIEQWRQADAAD